jgi:hypothetical protein
MEKWWHEVAELVVAGRTAEAIMRTRHEALAGSLAAQVRLACFGEEAGLSRDEVDQMLAQAESLVEPEDATCHWARRSAVASRLCAGTLCLDRHRCCRVRHAHHLKGLIPGMFAMAGSVARDSQLVTLQT